MLVKQNSIFCVICFMLAPLSDVVGEIDRGAFNFQQKCCFLITKGKEEEKRAN